jgi:hypothetical protein
MLRSYIVYETGAAWLFEKCFQYQPNEYGNTYCTERPVYHRRPVLPEFDICFRNSFAHQGFSPLISFMIFYQIMECAGSYIINCHGNIFSGFR